jgi:hypothetical protein
VEVMKEGRKEGRTEERKKRRRRRTEGRKEGRRRRLKKEKKGRKEGRTCHFQRRRTRRACRHAVHPSDQPQCGWDSKPLRRGTTTQVQFCGYLLAGDAEKAPAGPLRGAFVVPAALHFQDGVLLLLLLLLPLLRTRWPWRVWMNCPVLASATWKGGRQNTKGRDRKGGDGDVGRNEGMHRRIYEGRERMKRTETMHLSFRRPWTFLVSVLGG